MKKLKYLLSVVGNTILFVGKVATSITYYLILKPIIAFFMLLWLWIKNVVIDMPLAIYDELEQFYIQYRAHVVPYIKFHVDIINDPILGRIKIRYNCNKMHLGEVILQKYNINEHKNILKFVQDTVAQMELYNYGMDARITSQIEGDDAFSLIIIDDEGTEHKSIYKFKTEGEADSSGEHIESSPTSEETI